MWSESSWSKSESGSKGLVGERIDRGCLEERFDERESKSAESIEPAFLDADPGVLDLGVGLAWRGADLGVRGVEDKLGAEPNWEDFKTLNSLGMTTKSSNILRARSRIDIRRAMSSILSSTRQSPLVDSISRVIFSKTLVWRTGSVSMRRKSGDVGWSAWNMSSASKISSTIEAKLAGQIGVTGDWRGWRAWWSWGRGGKGVESEAREVGDPSKPNIAGQGSKLGLGLTSMGGGWWHGPEDEERVGLKPVGWMTWDLVSFLFLSCGLWSNWEGWKRCWGVLEEERRRELGGRARGSGDWLSAWVFRERWGVSKGVGGSGLDG